MPRIFKGSGSTLRLLIHKCVDYSTLSNLKVVLYTTDPEIAVQVTEGIVVEGNKVIFTLPSTAFASMDDGVINYIIEGTIDNDSFSTERQSDYYLKTPASYIAEGGSYQEKYLNIHANGLYEVVPDEGKDAMTKVSVNVDVQPNLGELNADFVDYDGEGNYWRYADEDGLDGFNYVKINASAYGEQKRNEGYGQGYSDGIIEGVEVGKTQAGAEAITLDVSSNGTYYTKYADIPEFNEPLTGDDFYSYAYLQDISYNTGIIESPTSRIELWYKKDDATATNGIVIGAQGGTFTEGIMKLCHSKDDLYYVEMEGNGNKTFRMTLGEWHHIIFSQAEGLIVDGEIKLTFENEMSTFEYPICINGTTGWQFPANGYFGMVKVDDKVFIPTMYGFKNVTTDNYLEIVKNGGYRYFKVEPIVYYNELIKQVNVNVPIKAYDPNTGVNMSFQFSDMTAIPDNINFEGKTNWYRCFEQCKSLQDITALRNIKINNAEHMFGFCGNLTDLSVADTWDFSDCTSMNYMLNTANNVADLSVSSYWSTSKVTNMGQLLNPSNLVTVGTLDCTSITGLYSTNPMYFASSKLKNVGGFLNLKTSLENNYSSLSRCPDLTKESYINIFNGLYDFTGNGETPNSNQGKIKIHSNAYDFLTDDDMAIAINKGWTITA